jgi:outer membrane lipoprotein-sorting protein
MRRLLVTLLVLPLLFYRATAQTTPTAEEVLDKYITAIGGKDALAKVTDVTTSMSSEGQMGAIMITRKQKLPNKFSMVINANGMEVMKQTGDGAKIVMGGMQGNSTTLEGSAAQQMTAMNVIFPELHYAENGVKSTVVGPEKIDGKDTYKLSHTTADGSATWTDNFDATTGLKVQSVTTTKNARGEMTMTSVYSDYKEVSGIKFPMTIAQQSPRGPMTMTVDNVKINKGLKDSDFTVK